MSSSRGFNQVILKGGLTKDPDLRYTQNRTAFLSFTLACTENVNRNGQWTDETEYVSCRVWRSQAEAVWKYCVKGTQLFIKGKFKTDKYEGKDGKTHWNSYVLVQDVQFCGGKRKDGGQDNAPAEANEGPDMPDGFSDVPF